MTKAEYIIRLRFELLMSNHILHVQSELIAMDFDGSFWEYQFEPMKYISDKQWRHTDEQVILTDEPEGRNGCTEIDCTEIRDVDWKMSLISIKELLND